MGTNSEEYRLWFVPGGLTERISPLQLRLALLKFRVPNATARTYRTNRPGATPGEVLGALATDLLLRVPLNRLADARSTAPGSTYVYEFGWPTPRTAARGLSRAGAGLRLRHPRPPRHPGPDRPGRSPGAGVRDAPGVGGLRGARGPGVAVLGRAAPGDALRAHGAVAGPGPARRRTALLEAAAAALTGTALTGNARTRRPGSAWSSCCPPHPEPTAVLRAGPQPPGEIRCGSGTTVRIAETTTTSPSTTCS